MNLVCQDAVDFHEDLYLRQIVVHNEADREREVRFFFAHDFHISGHEVGDSAYYEPERGAVFHYKGQRWFLINTAKEGPDGAVLGVDQWAVGIKEAQGKEGTWRDAEDGYLSGNAVAQGSVDSTVALYLDVPARGQATGWYWIAVGEDFRAVTRVNRAVRQKGPPVFLERTRHYWALWATKENEDRSALRQAQGRLLRQAQGRLLRQAQGRLLRQAQGRPSLLSLQFLCLPACPGLKPGTGGPHCAAGQTAWPQDCSPRAHCCSCGIGPLVGGRLVPLSPVGVREAGK
jgi:hypothetical protein